MMVRSLLCCAALSMLLTGCSWFQPEEKIIEKPYPVVPHVPESLRSCPDLPKSYDYVTSKPEEPAWQSEVSWYVTDLHEVARTCRSNLRGVDNILDEAESGSGSPR